MTTPLAIRAPLVAVGAPGQARIARWAGRAGAVLAVFSAGLHAVALAHMTHQGALVTTLMGVMIAGCLWCARHLWARAAPGDWATVAVMSLVMVGLHAPMSMAHHGHSVPSVALAVAAPGAGMPLMTWAVLTAGAEAAIATIALVITTNLRNRCLFRVDPEPQKGESRHDRRRASRLP